MELLTSSASQGIDLRKFARSKSGGLVILAEQVDFLSVQSTLSMIGLRGSLTGFVFCSRHSTTIKMVSTNRWQKRTRSILSIKTDPPSTASTTISSPSTSESDYPKQLDRRPKLPPLERFDLSPTPNSQPSPSAPEPAKAPKSKSKKNEKNSISTGYKPIKKTSKVLRSDVSHWKEYFVLRSHPDGSQVYACRFCTYNYLLSAKWKTIRGHTYQCPGNTPSNV